MQLFLYNIFLLLYQLSARITALFNPKAKKWLLGRKDILQSIKATLKPGERRIWMHCASVGEFEQGSPLIEAIRQQYPACKLVITFFSPSGYEMQKNCKLADYVFYLPMDGTQRSRDFVSAVEPVMAIFIKYEFWYYYFKWLQHYKIPVVLVSASFRASQPFFKWYGGLFRKILRKINLFFVQDHESQALLYGLGIPQQDVIVTGDTRYDRVFEIARLARRYPLMEQWMGAHKLLIAGSTWPDDEKLLKECLSDFPADWKLVVAPHEIHRGRIRQVAETFGSDSVLYSSLDEARDVTGRVLIIDNMGMLSSLYRYGQVAYVGGGFQSGGIHNTLEPAVFGLPVLFGPVYEKFVDAVRLKNNGFGFAVTSAMEAKEILVQFFSDETGMEVLQSKVRAYMQDNIGATEKIMTRLKQKLVLL